MPDDKKTQPFRFDKDDFQVPWRRPSENAAEQIERRSGVVITDEGFTANVIEGEHLK